MAEHFEIPEEQRNVPAEKLVYMSPLSVRYASKEMKYIF